VEITVSGQHFEVPDSVVERARRKLGRLSHYLPLLHDAVVEVDIAHEKAKDPDKRYVIRVSVDGGGTHLRAEERASAPETILPLCYGGSNGMLTQDFADAILFRRLGASRLLRTVCAAPTGAANMGLYGKMASTSYEDYPQAKLIVVWGVNPGVSGIHIMPFLKEARDNGAYVVVIDPRSTTVARQADHHIVRAEMNGLDFDHRVIRPWARDPAFYVTVFASESDQPAREGHYARGGVELWTYAFPPNERDAAEIGAGMRAIPGLLRQAQVNLIGAVHTIAPLVPALCARGRGRIAAIASVAAYRGLPYSPGYCASKAGLRAYAEALRSGLAPHGVGVTVVCPGFFSSPMTDRWEGPTPFLASGEHAARRIKRGIDRGRSRIDFPWPLVLGMRFCDLAPALIGDRIMRNFRFHIRSA